MKSKPQLPAECDSTGSSPARCSAAGSACKWCEHWEPQNWWDMFGYCPIFMKRTSRHHGDKCTAFQRRDDTKPQNVEQRNEND